MFDSLLNRAISAPYCITINRLEGLFKSGCNVLLGYWQVFTQTWHIRSFAVLRVASYVYPVSTVVICSGSLVFCNGDRGSRSLCFTPKLGTIEASYFSGFHYLGYLGSRRWWSKLSSSLSELFKKPSCFLELAIFS